jgi:hypothetical protein
MNEARMNQIDDGSAEAGIVNRLAISRGQLREILDPQRDDSIRGGHGGGRQNGTFPRSRTMRMLMTSRAAGTVAAVGAGLLISRPAILWRLLRMIPAGAIARMTILRLFTARGAKT